MNQEKETLILENIAHNTTPVRQRELAEIAGLSLGMTNALLKRLVDKGFVLMEKVNTRNVKYLLTTEGWTELGQRTENYLKKTLRSVVYYREAIEKLVVELDHDQYEAVNLVGESDLDFVLEWACNRHGWSLVLDENESDSFFTIYSEKRREPRDRADHRVYLAEV